MVNTTNQPLIVDDGMCIGNLSPITVLESSANENVQGEVSQVSPSPSELNNNNNITIYKAHNVRKKLNLRRRQSLGGGKSNSV